ncbi:hypothetical protein NMY22_g19339 [Coprinellus aureogranulatus]|nr:hypothetical protein NMY22_g19339 [Coprinellus aureogranulatus]
MPRRRGIRYRKPHRFSTAEVTVLSSAKKKWLESPETRQGSFVKQVVKDVVNAYMQWKNVNEIQKDKETKISNEVRYWLKNNCRTRTRHQRYGTKNYTGRRVAYRLNKETVDEEAKKMAAKTRKPVFNCRQAALTQLICGLSDEVMAEYRIIAKAWNMEGPPDDVKLATAKKQVQQRFFALAQDLYKMNNVVCIVHFAYKDEDGFTGGVLDYNREIHGRGFFDMLKPEYVDSAMESLWEQYAQNIFEGGPNGPAVQPAGRRKKPMVQLEFKEDGTPVIPDPEEVPEGVFRRDYSKDVLRAVLTAFWRMAGPAADSNVSIPWKELSKDWRDYIGPRSFPDEILETLSDPSAMKVDKVIQAVNHLRKRQLAGDDFIFEFTHYRTKTGNQPNSGRLRDGTTGGSFEGFEEGQGDDKEETYGEGSTCGGRRG